MGKYSKDLDETLVEKVKKISKRYGFDEGQDIKIEAISLNKLSTNVGEILKGNDLVKMFAGRDVVALALNEDCFFSVDEKTQEFWIESLLSQIYYDKEKEKITIQKPEISISVGMYNKYKDEAIDKAILAQITVEQVKEREKELKLMNKKK